AAFLALGVQCESPRLTALFAALSCLVMTSTLATWWSCVTEISGPHLGALFGLMNGLALFGPLASQYLFGAFADWREARGYTGRDQWDPAFGACVVVLLVAAGCWSVYTPRLVRDEA